MGVVIVIIEIISEKSIIQDNHSLRRDTGNRF